MLDLVVVCPSRLDMATLCCGPVWRVSLGLGMPPVGLNDQTPLDRVYVWFGTGRERPVYVGSRGGCGPSDPRHSPPQASQTRPTRARRPNKLITHVHRLVGPVGSLVGGSAHHPYFTGTPHPHNLTHTHTPTLGAPYTSRRSPMHIY